MNKEIKEILDSWKLGIEKGIDKNGIYVGGLCYSWEQLSLLLDYITNLQQENHELKSKLECYENGVYYSSKVDELEQENERLKETNVYCNRTDCVGRIKDSRKYNSIYQEKEDYKSRCEKASEYIKEHYPTSTINDQDDKYNLLNILQNGSDSQ